MKHMYQSNGRVGNVGAIFVEFALVLPLLLIMILTFFDLGQRQYYRMLFSAAAERAVSYAAVAPNMEDIDVDHMDGEAVIIETKKRAFDLLQGAGVDVGHLGAWASGAQNGSPPAWAWVNDIQVILPVDSEGVKSLGDMLDSEPIILEIEGYYARTFTGLGPARFVIRRATYRELSQNVSNPLAADATRPCPGAIDNRYGFANGECFCRVANTGLINEDGDCQCANQKQSYNSTSGRCECPGAPANATIDANTCEVTCNGNWSDGDGDGSCEFCAPPFTTEDPVATSCGCSAAARDACYAQPGSFNSATCECTPCTNGQGQADRYATDGTCGCKSVAELCGDSSMSVNPAKNCQCECPNEFFKQTGGPGSEECTCDVDKLIATCGSNEYVDTTNCVCTLCGQSGATRDDSDPEVCRCAPCVGGTFSANNGTSTRCAECVSCDSDQFEGDFIANPDSTDGAPPCVCPLNCDGEQEYLDSENNGASGGRCQCLSCEGQAVATGENTGCYCDKATLYNECVAGPGPDGQLEFDPSTACDCGAPCPKDFVVNANTGRCECPQSKIDGTTCGDGSTFSSSLCRCVGNCDDDGSTDDYDPSDPSGCYCDHDAKRAECHAANMPYSESTCSCAGNCWDVDSKYPHWNPATSRCYCDKDKYISDNQLDCNGKVWSQDSCSCGTAACTGKTPDLDPAQYKCVCNKSAKEAACKTDEKQWDANICDCGAPCPPSKPDYNAADMTCGCPAIRKQNCIATGFAFDAQNCQCGGNCSEQAGKNAVDSNGNCVCNRAENVRICNELDPPQSTGSNCGCGGTCGGTTPDLVNGTCTCNRNWNNGNGDAGACGDSEYFNPTICQCATCGENAAPGTNANHDCQCVADDCEPGMIATPTGDGISCECACPGGSEYVGPGFSPNNVCMPITDDCPTVGSCIWDGSGWTPSGTE